MNEQEKRQSFIWFNYYENVNAFELLISDLTASCGKRGKRGMEAAENPK